MSDTPRQPTPDEVQREVSQRVAAEMAATPSDARDARRYRALRAGAILALDEEQDLVLGVTVVASDEFGDIQRPMTARVAPFLTDAERSDLNGDRPESKGYVRGSDAIDRVADWLLERGAGPGVIR